MTQETVSQRLKILIKALGENTKSFSQKYGVNESSTRGYIDRGSVPSADYVGALVNSIEHLNPYWLLLGKGEMFLDPTLEMQVMDIKHPNTAVDAEKEILRRENDLLWNLIASKDALIESKDAVIAAKEEVLEVLRESRNRLS